MARTEEEADRQAAGEDVTKVKDDYAADYAAEQAAIAAEALFEGDAVQARSKLLRPSNRNSKSPATAGLFLSFNTKVP